ncbi:MAG: small basic protein [Planctomycetota bacterium]|jgi:small basic protein (TIGR04137 family)
MSIHKSLNLGGGIKSVRSVFTRRERVEKLMDKGEFEEGDMPLGMPKVKTRVRTITKRQLKALAAAERETAIAELEAAQAALRAAEAAGEVLEDSAEVQALRAEVEAAEAHAAEASQAANAAAAAEAAAEAAMEPQLDEPGAEPELVDAAPEDASDEEKPSE